VGMCHWRQVRDLRALFVPKKCYFFHSLGNLERNRNFFGSADLVVFVLRDFVGRVLAIGFSQFEYCSVWNIVQSEQYSN